MSNDDDTTHGRSPDMDVPNDTFAMPEPQLPPDQPEPQLIPTWVPEVE